MMKSSFITVLPALVVSAASCAEVLKAQESPFVPEKLAQALKNEVSGDRAYNYVLRLMPYQRIMESKAFIHAAVAGLGREYGFENILAVRQKFDGDIIWNPCFGRSTSTGANC